jgi:hypothetical protein
LRRDPAPHEHEYQSADKETGNSGQNSKIAHQTLLKGKFQTPNTKLQTNLKYKTQN